MFAYLASQNSKNTEHCSAALVRFAEHYGVSKSKLQKITLQNFHVDYFDTANELHFYKNERYLLFLSGILLNREAIQAELDCKCDTDAELILKLYLCGREGLNNLDGHISFAVYDAEEKHISLLCDRFGRYSVVYYVSDATYVSSHTNLLYSFLDKKTLDLDALSQSVHFRWLTGDKRLFTGIHQVLAGSLTHIDENGDSQREAYFNLTFQRNTELDKRYWIKEIDTALDQSLSLIAKKHNVIGVPLSGGVDSSLLLAKAKDHFGECVAVTPRFSNGENPELDNARYFAKELGVRHIITDVDDNYIQDFFPRIIRLHEQPPRNYSDFALAKALETLSTEVDAFLYGEGADSFFGSFDIRYVLNVNKKAELFQIVPSFLRNLIATLIPEKQGKLLRLKWMLSGGIDIFVNSIGNIKYITPPWKVFRCARTPYSGPILNEYNTHVTYSLSDRTSIQVLSSAINHIENTGRLATYYGLQMYAPFVLNDVRSVAVRFPLQLQFEDGMYKRVLRELACRFFQRETIYAKKYGFPTPTKHWLKGPLNDRVQKSCDGEGSGREFYSADVLSSLSIEDDFEHFWYSICLDELLFQLDNEI